MNRPHARALSAAAVAVVSLWAAPVSAGLRPAEDLIVEDLIVEAQVVLDSEILALVELDAFGPDVPQVLLDVHTTWESYVADLDRDDLIAWVVDADADGAEVLRQLDLADVPLTAEVRRTVGPLDRADLDALFLGEGPISIDPIVYVRARGQLVAGPPPDAPPVTPPPATASPATVPVTVTPVTVTPASVAPVTVTPVTVTPVTVTPATVTPATVAPATTASIQPAGASGGSGGSRPILAAVLGLAVLAAIAWAIVRRRPQPDHAATPAMQAQLFDQLADAARRMAGALEEAEIARIAIDEAMQMVDARHGAFIDVSELGLTAMATSGDVLAVHSLTGGLLSRVADTGQSIRRITHDEPAVTSLPAALLAIPVIGSGRVTAILFLVRPDSAPFTDADEAALHRLAPIVASALGAASRHGDATALSRTDALTGLANRRRLDEDLAALTAAATGRPIALAMADVDHFKHFNDRNGHAAGDDALRAVADALQRAVRPRDRVYRYGGEEFTLVMPDIDRGEAEAVVERARQTVERIELPGTADQPGGALTISFGVTIVDHTRPDAALQLADRALYEAKSAGRNRIVVSDAVV